MMLNVDANDDGNVTLDLDYTQLLKYIIAIC
jgi:hypothetical protein